MTTDTRAYSPSIFLCHAHEDFDRVHTLYKALKSAGLSPWLDKYDLVPGEDWQRAIEKAVRESDFFLAFFSEAMVSRTGYVHREYRIALDAYLERPPGSIFLIPVRLDDCEIPKLGELGVRLSDFQWVDLFRRHTLSESDIAPILKAVERQSKWRRPQKEVVSIVEEYKGKVDESLIETMRVRRLPYTDQMLEVRDGKDAPALTALEDKAFDLYISSGHVGRFDMSLEFHYLVARYLYRVMPDGDPSVCRHKPFVYLVHQYLSEMIRTAEPAERACRLAVLRRWLCTKDIYQTTRDFAAFELGMCKAREARADLMETLADPFELLLVRCYSAMSLGMICNPDDLKRLAELYGREDDQQLKDVIAHVVIHINGGGR